MLRKILFPSLFFMTCLTIFSRSNDILFDPKEIIIKPKAVNGYFLFMVKYFSSDFKQLVKKSVHNGTGDRKFIRDNGSNENNILNSLYALESIGSNPFFRSGIIYDESMIVTIRNLESKQEFQVLIFPFMKRAFIPGVTVGKYRFEKLIMTVSLGYSNVYNFELNINDELPQFVIKSNTAFIYGLVDLRKGNIKQVFDEKCVNKLRKYVELMKKFKKNEKVKIVEFNGSEITKVSN